MRRLHLSTRRPANDERGLSLIELIVFIVIVSVGLVGALSVFNLTTRKSADPMIRKQVIAVAEAMMEEVMLKNFADAGCTPCVANTQADRPNYTSVGNYNNWNKTGVQVLDILGGAVTGPGSYTVTVAVAAAALSDITSANAKSITVTVTGPGETLTLTGFRTNY